MRYLPLVPKITQEPMALIPTSEVAALLRMHVATVVRKAQAGEIPFAMKLPGETGAYLFDRNEIERLARERAS